MADQRTRHQNRAPPVLRRKGSQIFDGWWRDPELRGPGYSPGVRGCSWGPFQRNPPRSLRGTMLLVRARQSLHKDRARGHWADPVAGCSSTPHERCRGWVASADIGNARLEVTLAPVLVALQPEGDVDFAAGLKLGDAVSESPAQCVER